MINGDWEMTIYIKTSKRNYLINLAISIFLATLLSIVLYAKISLSNSFPVSIIYWWLIFVHSFRVLEYIFTKKSIWAFSIFWFGNEESGKKAKFYFLLNFTLLIFLILLALFYEHLL